MFKNRYGSQHAVASVDSVTLPHFPNSFTLQDDYLTSYPFSLNLHHLLPRLQSWLITLFSISQEKIEGSAAVMHPLTPPYL